MELMESGKIRKKETGKMVMEPEKPKNDDLNGNDEALTGVDCVQKKKSNETDRRNEVANGKVVEQVKWNAIHDEPLNPMERNMKTGTEQPGEKGSNAYKYGKLKGMIIGSNKEERITCSSAMEFHVNQCIPTPKGVPFAHMLSGFGSIEKRPFKLDINYTNQGKESFGEVMQDHFFEGMIFVSLINVQSLIYSKSTNPYILWCNKIKLSCFKYFEAQLSIQPMRAIC